MKSPQIKIQIRNLAALFVLMVVILGSFGASLPLVMEALAISPPNIISYQGRILNANGVPVASASESMEFRLFDSLAAGTCLWSNSSTTCDGDTPASTVARTVTLTDGLFSENLGDTSLGAPYAAISDATFADNASLYLEVEIAGETLAPRKRVVATAFAMNADTLDGLDSTDFLAGASPSLDDAYDNFGASASTIFVDAAEGQTGGLTFSIDPTADMTVNLESQVGGDFIIRDATGAQDFLTISGDETIEYENIVSTTADAITLSAFALSSGQLINMTANLLTSGGFLAASTSAAFSSDLFSTTATGAATGRLLHLSYTNASATGEGILIENLGTGSSIFVDANGDTGGVNNDASGGAVHITNTGNVAQGLTTFSSNGATQGSPLVSFRTSSAAFDQPILELNGTGTREALMIDPDGTGGGIMIDTDGTSGISLDINHNNNDLALYVESTSTTANLATFTNTALTTGQVLELVGGDFTDDSGRALFIDTNETTGTADLVLIQSDFGGVDNNVFRIEADGGVFSDVGFTAGAFSTSYFDGSITSTGAFTYSSPTSFTWEDDAANTLMTLTDAGTTGTLSVTGDMTCTDCFDYSDFADAMALDASTSVTLDGAESYFIFNTGIANTGYDLSSSGDFLVAVDTNPVFRVNDDSSFSYDDEDDILDFASAFDINVDNVTAGTALDLSSNSMTTGDVFNLTANALTTGNGFLLESSSGVLTSADLANFEHDATYAAGATISGQLLQLVRDITVTSGVVTNASAAVRINSFGTEAGGTYTDSALLLDIEQFNAGSTGEAVRITNVGSGESLVINQQGSTSGVVDITRGGALHINNSSNDNHGLTVYSGNASPTSALMQIMTSNVGFDQNVVWIRNFGTGPALQISQAESVGTTFDLSEGGAFHVNNSGNDDRAVAIITAVGSDQNTPLMELLTTDATFDQPLLELENAGTGAALYVNASGDTGSAVDPSVGGALHVGNATENDDYLFTVYNNNGAAANQANAYFFQDHIGFDQDVVAIRNDTNTSTSSSLYIDHNFTDDVGSAPAIHVEANTTGELMMLFNDGNDDANDGIAVQACLDTNPGATCDFLRLLDGDGTVLGAIEGDGAGGVTNASTGSDYAELFPGVLANFNVGDVLALDSSGNVTFATASNDPIGTYSFAPNTLGNWFEDWQTAGTYVPVALLGQVPVNANASTGAIAVGDYLTMSSTAGVVSKLNGPGYTIGIALEDHAAGSGQIDVYVNPGWHAGDAIAFDGANNTFEDDFLFTATGTASSGTPGADSHGLTFRGSGWDGASAQDVEMTILADVNDSDEYRLSIQNTSGTEVASVSDQGDLAIAGRLYPSDQGTLQTDKYIFYDSTNSPSMDYMRTNAAGWGVGSYDFAEMFPSLDAVAPGELVTFADGKETIRRSTGKTYDQTIAGIVSTRPGFLAGEFIDGHVPIALAGRVPTYVSTENGAIKPGDPLTTSSKPGYAMRATEPGPIVGYAMEAFNKGTGSIIVFVNVSYYDGGPVSDSPAAINAASGISNLSNLDMSGNLNLNSGRILSVGSITGVNNNWRITENGDIVTKGRLTSVVRSYQNQDVDTYAVTSRETTIQLSGTVEMQDGRATVNFETFDPSFNDIISSTALYRVFLTADDVTGQLFVTNRSNAGFDIEETGSLSDANIDFLVIAYHKDFEPAVVAPSESVEEPIIEEAVVEEPIVEDPLIEEPPIEEVVEEPEPVVEEIVTEEVPEEPTIEEPVVEELPIE